MTLQECQLMSDRDLAERVRGGDTALYELIMRRHNQRMFRMIRSVIREDSEAEDILQDAWVRIYEHLHQFEGRSSFATWIMRIAYHEALNRARKQKRSLPLEDETGEIMSRVIDESSPRTTPEDQAIHGQFSRIIQTAVDALPDGYRSVFVLREIEGMSTAEVSGCLELSEEAVKTRLHRSRAMLRRDIQARIGPVVAETFAFMGVRCDRTVVSVLDRIGCNERRT